MTRHVEEEGNTRLVFKVNPNLALESVVRWISPLGIGAGSAVLRRSSRSSMGDQEDETFESTDAGASETYPMEAGQIRKSGHIMIKGNPCKVIDVSTSKT